MKFFQNYFYLSWIFLPFLYFAIGNFNQFSLIEIFIVFAIPSCLMSFLLAMSFVLNKIIDKRHSLFLSYIFSSGIYMFFNFALFGLSNMTYLLLSSAIIIFIPILAIKSSEFKRVITFTTAAMIFVCFVQLFLQILNFTSNSSSIDTRPTKSYLLKTSSYELPNVYSIILDAYSNSDELLKLGFDNSSFENMLENKGFFIAKSAKTNFIESYLSMYTFWSMDYPQERDFQENINLQAIKNRLLFNNPALDNLRDLGYNYIKMGPNQSTAQDCSGHEDVCLFKINENDGTAGGLSSNIFIQIFKMTPLHKIWYKYFFSDQRNIYLKSTLSDAEKAFNFDQKKPYLLSINVWQPHAPYIYDKNCLPHEKPIPYEGSWEKNKINYYLDSTKCVNLQAESLIEKIEKNDPNAIVILQSDHGHSFITDVNPDPKTWTKEQISSKISILWAIKTPKRCKRNVYDEITSVNSMRLVLSCITFEEPDFIEDISYIHNLRTQKDFIKIKN